MNQEIELYSKIADPLTFIERLGGYLAKSGMTGGDRPEQGVVLASACLFERKSPIQVLREYHIIDGRLSDRADAMLAKFRQAGGKHKVIARTETEAAVELTKDGQSITSRVTWEELQKEPFIAGRDGKLKKNYATPRARMQTMWARAISDGVRTIAPEIVCGIYTPEEIEDYSGGHHAEPAPLLRPKPEPVPVNVKVEPPAPAPEPTPIEVPVEVVPTITPTVNLATKRLDVATSTALIAAIGEDNMDAAITFLIGKGKIFKTIDELSPDYAAKILSNPAKFVAAIQGRA